jgi:ribose transport system substrate-binding protein
MLRTRNRRLLSGFAIAASLTMVVSACSKDKTTSTEPAATETTAAAGATETTAAAADSEAAPVTEKATETTAAAAAAPDTAAATPAGGGGVAEAEALVAAASAAPKFAAPAGVGKYDFAALKGKKVAIINLVKAVPILTQWEDEMTTAMKGSGVELTSVDGKFDPNEWGRGIEQAVAAKADLIFLLGVPPNAVAPQIAEAKKAGIPVLSSLQGYPGKSLATVADLTADVGYDYRTPGKLMGDWFVADSKGKGNALIMSSDDNASSPDVWGAMQDEIKRLCPDCKVKREDSTVPQWGDGTLQQRTKALVQEDPTITHILAVYDGMTLAIEPGLVEAGVADKIRVSGFNGTPAVMANVQKGTAVKMDVGNPNMWFSAGAADAIFSVLSGKKATEDAGVPFRIFTTDNLKGVDTTKEDPKNWYGIDPLGEYRKLWGLS